MSENTPQLKTLVSDVMASNKAQNKAASQKGKKYTQKVGSNKFSKKILPGAIISTGFVMMKIRGAQALCTLESKCEPSSPIFPISFLDLSVPSQFA